MPFARLTGGLPALHKADDISIDWLTTYGICIHDNNNNIGQKKIIYNLNVRVPSALLSGSVEEVVFKIYCLDAHSILHVDNQLRGSGSVVEITASIATLVFITGSKPVNKKNYSKT